MARAVVGNGLLSTRIQRMTYAEAEQAFENGSLETDEWIAYRHAWRRSAVRYSSLASEHDACDCEVLA